MGIKTGIFAIAFVRSFAGGSDQISGNDVANEATLVRRVSNISISWMVVETYHCTDGNIIRPMLVLHKTLESFCDVRDMP